MTKFLTLALLAATLTVIKPYAIPTANCRFIRWVDTGTQTTNGGIIKETWRCKKVRLEFRAVEDEGVPPTPPSPFMGYQDEVVR